MSDSALRCLLALIHLSFRFDPTEGEWTHPGDWFTRSDVEAECGLSDQGTRNGLDELESTGWVRADRTGQSHQYQLTLEVPNKRFTYVPTALLEDVGDVGSSTQLRVVLAVLRRTWGWTHRKSVAERGPAEIVHDRWARFSNRELAEATGRSQSAIKGAAKALQGEWLARARPGHGPYQYCFLPEAIGDGSEDRGSFCGGDANNLPPDRQKSGPPSSYKENSTKDKQERPSKTSTPHPQTEPPPPENDAMPVNTQPRNRSGLKDQSQPNPDGENRTSLTADFSDLSPEKRDLAEKLANVGVWAGRIAEILSRFSTDRIRANFQLYRRRAAEQTIRKPGAWLYAAITDGYALPDADSEGTPDGKSASHGSLPPLEHKETLSEVKKDAYVAQGIGKNRFHRCPPSRDRPDEPRFMYFDPEVGGPAPRTSASRRDA
ncbi:MAG: hypothetical protein ABEK75_12790 [Salinibacter sp.]